MGASTDNKNLHRAKVAKDDEFYTPYDYVKEELDHYDFSGLRAACPFDKESSAFVRYFTELVRADRCRSLDFSHIDDEVITRVYPDFREPLPLLTKNKGDFFGAASRYWSEDNIVVSNPPFSKLTTILPRLIEDGVLFLLVVSGSFFGTVPTYIKYIREGKLSAGALPPRGVAYDRPDGSKKTVKSIFITNYEPITREYKQDIGATPKRLEELRTFDELYNGEPVYCVDRYQDAPIDYNGYIAIPGSSWWRVDLTKYAVIGRTSSAGIAPSNIDGVKKFARLIIRRKR